MKAAMIHEPGGANVLKVGEVPTPQPQPGRVLIEVLAAGINRLEDHLRQGAVVPELRVPACPGRGCVGSGMEIV